MRMNWSHDPTLIGCFIACCVDRLNLKMEIERQGEWIVIKYLNRVQWIKQIVEDSNDIEKGDLLRLTYPKPLEPQNPSYQYVLKRVAYLNEKKELVLTKNWDEYKKRMMLTEGEHPFYIENKRQWVKIYTK
jgi:hypothetical protein